jgi:hypothetical protein
MPILETRKLQKLLNSLPVASTDKKLATPKQEESEDDYEEDAAGERLSTGGKTTASIENFTTFTETYTSFKSSDL